VGRKPATRSVLVDLSQPWLLAHVAVRDEPGLALKADILKTTGPDFGFGVFSRRSPSVAPPSALHPLLFYIPCYNLPRVHEILSRSTMAGRMDHRPNYLAVLRLATAKPNREDRPGQLVSSQRRARAGQAVGGDQKAGGF